MPDRSKLDGATDDHAGSAMTRHYLRRNMALVMLTYFLTIFGTFLTRSGLIDSVHTFAQSDVGDYFIVALVFLAVVSIGLILWRVFDGSLKSSSEVVEA